jgi:hypothetical protein
MVQFASRGFNCINQDSELRTVNLISIITFPCLGYLVLQVNTCSINYFPILGEKTDVIIQLFFL